MVHNVQEDGSLKKVSPFLINKILIGIGEAAKNAQKLQDRTLLVEIHSEEEQSHPWYE